MIPYHYSVVRCRDAAVHGEPRNVGLLVVSPTARKAWLRRGGLKDRAHLVGDEAAFVRALLDALEDAAQDVAREGDPARVHDWMRSRARPTEDSVSLSSPAVGIAADLHTEVGRLAEAYLGKSGSGGRTEAEKVQVAALRSLGLDRRFGPRVIQSGPASWRFARVADLPDGRSLVFNALQFAQKKPEGILESAWVNVGRAHEVVHEHPDARWLTVAMGPSSGPTGRAFARAVEVMREGDLNLVAPTPDAIATALAHMGLGKDVRAAEAK
ncbi:MAG TPA: DUF3037 domain-containing protein [Myxococcota bacterium]|nr:DUF3037 domain-containing protein [Myxococcota bacterium]